MRSMWNGLEGKELFLTTPKPKAKSNLSSTRIESGTCRGRDRHSFRGVSTSINTVMMARWRKVAGGRILREVIGGGRPILNFSREIPIVSMCNLVSRAVTNQVARKVAETEHHPRNSSLGLKTR